MRAALHVREAFRASPGAHAREAKLRLAFKHVVLPILTALAVLIAWELAFDLKGIPKVILPAPSDIAGRIWSIRGLL